MSLNTSSLAVSAFLPPCLQPHPDCIGHFVCVRQDRKHREPRSGGGNVL